MVMSVTRGMGGALIVAQGILSARYFGTSYQKDAFLVAQSIPTMVATFLVGGMYSVLMINLVEIARTEGVSGQRAFTRRILSQIALVLLLPVLFSLAAPAWVVGLAAPGFSSEKTALLASLFRLSVFCAAGTLFMAGVRCRFESRGQFLVPAVISLATPLASLVILVALVGRIGIYALAIGPLLGISLSLLLLISLIPRYIKDPAGFVGEPATVQDTTRRVRGFWTAFLPMSLGANFGQINVVVDNVFASYLPTGSITILAFAYVIVANTQMLSTIAFAEVAFSRLAASTAASAEDLKALFRTQVRHMLLLIAPLSIGMVVFATPLVRLLFERGAFTPEATAGVATTLRAYGPGMFFMGYLALFSSLLTSKRRFARISMTAAGIIVVNAILDFVFIKTFGLTGIALGTTVTIMIHAWLLTNPVRLILGDIQGPGDLNHVVRVMTSALLMGGVVLGFTTAFETLFDVASLRARFAEVFLGLAIGAGTYLGMLLLFRVAEIRLILRRLVNPMSRLLAPLRGFDGH